MRVFLGAVVVLLSGCSGGSDPPPIFEPIKPDPTRTATPARTEQAPVAEPTSVVSDQVEIVDYSHASNRFRISYPENWQPFDRPDGVVFIEPGNGAGYSVTFNEVDEKYSEEELNQYLVSFVAQNFAGTGTDFKAIKQEQSPDGSVVAQFSSRDPNLGQAISEVRIMQQDRTVFVVLINATVDQWAVSQNQLQALADTFVPLNKPDQARATPTPEPVPVWTLIGPTTNTFGFFYPSNWEIANQEENLVRVRLPGADLVFTAEVLEWPGPADEPEAAEAAALAYLEQLSQDYTDVESLAPKEFPLDTLTGTTIDFLYTDQDGTDMAGSVIAAGDEDKIYQVVFQSPAQAYQAALQWFNPMYKSFKILPVEEIITPEP